MVVKEYPSFFSVKSNKPLKWLYIEARLLMEDRFDEFVFKYAKSRLLVT